MPASSSCPIVGSATLTTVMSSPTMKRLRQQIASTLILPRRDSSDSITVMKVALIAGRGNSGQADAGASSGSQRRRLGRYQLREPSSFMLAGSRIARMTVASIRIAVASPMPICLAI